MEMREQNRDFYSKMGQCHIAFRARSQMKMVCFDYDTQFFISLRGVLGSNRN